MSNDDVSRSPVVNRIRIVLAQMFAAQIDKAAAAQNLHFSPDADIVAFYERARKERLIMAFQRADELINHALSNYGPLEDDTKESP